MEKSELLSLIENCQTLRVWCLSLTEFIPADRHALLRAVQRMEPHEVRKVHVDHEEATGRLYFY